MSDKNLYSYTGTFNTPDEIIHAAEKAAAKGYKKYDTKTRLPDKLKNKKYFRPKN